MNDNRWLFVGTDKRISKSSQLMANRGYECVYLATDSFTEELRGMILKFRPGHIVFSIHEFGGKFPVDILDEGTRLYAGVASKEWIEPFAKAGIEVQHYLHDEQFIWRNAWLTAEGFLLEYYLNTGRIVSGEHFYVSGFGKVGKMVAHALKALNAKVTVIARSDQQLGEATAMGYGTKRMTTKLELKHGLLVNTIPARWYSFENDTKRDIFDLASAPGCLASISVPEYYRILPGLPGKHFPVDAAEALADAVERIYRR
ncbi:hypothetical protein ACXYMX_02480 [Sporosarcina sp. CAU 1771]